MHLLLVLSLVAYFGVNIMVTTAAFVVAMIIRWRSCGREWKDFMPSKGEWGLVFVLLLVMGVAGLLFGAPIAIVAGLVFWWFWIVWEVQTVRLSPA